MMTAPRATNMREDMRMLHLYLFTRGETATFVSGRCCPQNGTREDPLRRLALVTLLVLGSAVFTGWMAPGATNLGILSCTVGRAIETRASAETLAAGEAREMACSFKTDRSGVAEYYGAVVKSITTVGRLPGRATLIWIVKGPFGSRVQPGFLQQTYSIDPAVSATQTAPLTGERDTDISLHPMADTEPGSASKENADPPKHVITSVELVLKAATG
jgi:hypothetical protein